MQPVFRDRDLDGTDKSVPFQNTIYAAGSRDQDLEGTDKSVRFQNSIFATGF